MKNTFLLTKMARSMLIAGMVLGITGTVYAQSGAAGGGSAGTSGGIGGAIGGIGGIVGGGGNDIGVGGGVAGQAGQAGPGGGDIVGDADLPRLGQESSRSRTTVRVPGLENSAGPEAGQQEIPRE